MFDKLAKKPYAYYEKINPFYSLQAHQIIKSAETLYINGLKAFKPFLKESLIDFDIRFVICFAIRFEIVFDI